MSESYTMPLERKRWELFSLNVPKPWHAPLESKDIQCMVDKAKQNQSPITCKKKKNLWLILKFVCFFSGPGLGKGETFQVPRMYNTEYQFYGSEKPVTI